MDTPALFCAAYAGAALVLSQALPNALLLVGTLGLLLIPALALSRRPASSGYQLAWNVASACFILAMLMAQVFFDHPSHSALGLICLFLLLHRWSNPRGLREHLEAWGLSCLLLLVASLKGHGLGVLLLMAGWAVSSLQLFSLLGHFRVAGGDARRTTATQKAPRLSPVVVNLPAVFLVTMLFMVLLPRTKPVAQVRAEDRELRSSGTRALVQSGFSEAVSFASMGDIQQTDSLALRIEGPPPTRSLAGLRIRVSTVDDFDGWTWKRSVQSSQSRRSFSGDPVILDSRSPEAMKRGSDFLTLQLVDFPGRLVPIPEEAVAISGLPADAILHQELDGRISFVQSRPTREYQVWLAPAGAPSALPLLTGPASWQSKLIPEELQDAVAEASARIFTPADETLSAEEKAQKAVRWFRRNGRYTLQVGELPEGPAAVRAFLTGSPEGHCELFATALALVLRDQGIPARLVTGFSGGEYADDGRRLEFRVMNKNAHAWVEAMTEDQRWKSFDPTPTEPLTSVVTVGWLTQWQNFLRSQGDRISGTIEGYGYEDQRRFVTGLAQSFSARVASVERGALLRAGRRFAVNMQEPKVIFLALVLASLNAAAFFLHRYIQQRKSPPRRIGQRSESMLGHLLEVLQGDGAPPAPEQSDAATSRALILSAARVGGVAPTHAETLAMLYDRWRYAGAAEHERHALMSELRQVLATACESRVRDAVRA